LDEELARGALKLCGSVEVDERGDEDEGGEAAARRQAAAVGEHEEEEGEGVEDEAIAELELASVMIKKRGEHDEGGGEEEAAALGERPARAE
jgi:hypothetical protein